MDNDRIKGKMDEVAGKVKSKVGEMTGDRRPRRKASVSRSRAKWKTPSARLRTKAARRRRVTREGR